MAVIYLRSTDGSDADNGSTWALAKLTLASALTAAGAGGTVYVSKVHNENITGTMNYTTGTSTSPVKVLGVDDTGNPQPPTTLSTGAIIRDDSGNGMTISGNMYIYGINFQSPLMVIGTATASSTSVSIDNCVLQIAYAGTGTFMRFGSFDPANNHSVQISLNNTPLKFANADQFVQLTIGNTLWWTNTASAIQGTTPTGSLFRNRSLSGPALAEFHGIDLSAYSGTLFTIGTDSFLNATLIDCKLHASMTLVTGSSGFGGQLLRMINCNSGAVNYAYRLNRYEGDIYHESTIVLSGGASDGTTPISRKMTTSANTQFWFPLYSDWTSVWNEGTGSSLTASFETVTDGVTLTDAEAWIEVEYLGSSATPLSTRVSDRATNILTTAANQTSSSVTWTTTGLSSPVKQKLSTAFTPQMKGLVKARVALAKVSTTMYFDPKLSLTGITSDRQYQSQLYVNELGGGGGGIVRGNMSGGTL